MLTTQATKFGVNGSVEEAEFLNELLPALHRLDTRLEVAVQSAQALFAADAATDRYRGLYIGEDEVKRLLDRPPGAPLFGAKDGDVHEGQPAALGKGSQLLWLQHTYALSAFDLDVLLLAIAPELDRRYERLYAYLQDHVGRRWPTVDLALDLLCENAVTRIQRRVHFDPHAPLLHHGLIHLFTDQDHGGHSLLAQMIRVDEQVVRFLLHQDDLDGRLVPFCRLLRPTAEGEQNGCTPVSDPALSYMATRAVQENEPLRLYMRGPAGVGKRKTALAVARHCGLPLLTVDLKFMPITPAEFDPLLRLIFRFAHLYSAMLYFDGLQHLKRDDPGAPALRLFDQVADCPGVVVLSGTQPWVPETRNPLGVLIVNLPMPDFVQRRACWQVHLAQVGSELNEAELDLLADRFRLTPAQIAEATSVAQQRARQGDSGNPAGENSPTLARLFSAARAQSGHELMALARIIEPRYTWNDIVLPEDALTQLQEICQRVACRHRVLGEWGFDRKLALGKGVTVLFAGPSGAGKTMAAEILANELGLDLYKVDLSGVVSKYIGETEKNLERIFVAAENANAILFFDEADALFGKRSEVSDAHDRYANIEISYLLQRMEEYDGIAILATNLRQNLDDAFIRRTAFTIHFPFPDAEHRLRIWARIWPPETPLAADVDLQFLAERCKLSGGNIKNVALAAAFLAAAEQRPVAMQHLQQAIRREYQKIGKVLDETDLVPTR